MLLRNFKKKVYYVKPGVTDMRGGFKKLPEIIRQAKLDPFNSNIFLFCGKRRNMIKMFVFDDGYWVVTYRLLRGTFAWPETADEAKTLKYEDIERLLGGQDIFRKVAKVEGPVID